MTGFDFSLFTSSFANQTSVETSGLDYAVTYNFNVGGGEASLRLNGVYVDEFLGINQQGVVVDATGTNGRGVNGAGANAQQRVNMVATYDRDNHSVRWTSRWADGIENAFPNLPNEANTSEGSATYHDLVYTYSLGGNNDSSVTLSVLNVGDKEPPLLANTLTTARSNLFDTRGRMWRLSYNTSF